MNTSKILLTLATIFLFQTFAIGQDFIPPFTAFSRKKVAYVTKADGTSLEGTIKGIKRKKGLIKSVKIEATDGKQHNLAAAKIKEMYLPPSGLAKFAQTMEFMNDATKWSNTDLNKDIINKGYVFFENAEVMVKKKKMTLLMQLLNPSFSNKIKVYHDPFARETMSASVGGVKVAGGNAKSYYIKDKKVAYLLKKKTYDKQYDRLFKGCDTVLANKSKWGDFAKAIYTHSEECP